MISSIKTSRPSQPRRESAGGDASVAAAAQRRLQNSAYVAHRRLRCHFHEGALTLFGRVSCYYLRQTAQALVADLEGVEELVDRIEVAAAAGEL